MPVYCYECPKCKTTFDNFWPVDKYDAPTPCPECNEIAKKAIWIQAQSISCWSNERGGFTAGFNPGLGEHVETRGELKRKLREKGLVEVGNDAPKKQVTTKKSTYLTDKKLKDMSEMGVKVSGQEAAALKRGEKLHRK